MPWASSCDVNVICKVVTELAPYERAEAESDHAESPPLSPLPREKRKLDLLVIRDTRSVVREQLQRRGRRNSSPLGASPLGRRNSHPALQAPIGVRRLSI